MQTSLLTIVIPNIIAIELCLITLVETKIKGTNAATDKVLFYLMALAIIFLSAVDTIAWGLNGVVYSGSKTVLRVVNCIYYLLNPVTSFLWALYLDYKVFNSNDHLKKFLPAFVLPLVLNAIFAFSNLFTDLIFTITDASAYLRTDFIWLTYTPLLYLAYTILLITVYHKRLPKANLFSLTFFPVVPLLCFVVQMLFYGISIIPVSQAFALILLFIKVQNDDLVIDHLTNISNRRHLDNMLRTDFAKRTSMVGIMFDIDNFKRINDTFGHAVGDNALTEFAKVLRRNITMQDFLARYAGDEFVVIIKNGNEASAQKCIDSVNKSLASFNNFTEHKYKLETSAGYYISTKDDGETIDTFISKLDANMYQNKRNKKNNTVSTN